MHNLNPTNKGKGIEKDPIKIEEDKAKAASILRHHLIDSLKHEYTNYEDPKLLWEELNERFGHNKSVLLPKAIDECILLQQQYRERHFRKYHELLKTLLIAEQNNELLLKNHNRRPVGTMPFNETNMIERNVRHRGRGNIL
ncbi:uncharacterized protein LOC130798864 [Amaranthus tricolor]|uniref:uncharacterized protein LOC130798864 n=1 Tax=Amaranthus tricolor TaxID=29722 RepID=UPI00258792F3|nr:uncharacterized protein LOC130798864 [Amaranthus tricolor]